MTAAADNYRKLNALIDGLTEKELTTEFNFAADEKKSVFQGGILMLFPEKDVHLAIGFPVVGPRQEGFFFSILCQINS